jgi:type III restriction enzyme
MPEMETARSWIQKTPGVCGGDACIRNTRITVHGLVEWRQLGLSDAQILESIEGLTPADLEAAWAYYAQHRDEIEQVIRADREA